MKMSDLWFYASMTPDKKKNLIDSIKYGLAMASVSALTYGAFWGLTGIGVWQHQRWLKAPANAPEIATNEARISIDGSNRIIINPK